MEKGVGLGPWTASGLWTLPAKCAANSNQEKKVYLVYQKFEKLSSR